MLVVIIGILFLVGFGVGMYFYMDTLNSSSSSDSTDDSNVSLEEETNSMEMTKDNSDSVSDETVSEVVEETVSEPETVPTISMEEEETPEREIVSPEIIPPSIMPINNITELPPPPPLSLETEADEAPKRRRKRPRRNNNINKNENKPINLTPINLDNTASSNVSNQNNEKELEEKQKEIDDNAISRGYNGFHEWYALKKDFSREKFDCSGKKRRKCIQKTDKKFNSNMARFYDDYSIKIEDENKISEKNIELRLCFASCTEKLLPCESAATTCKKENPYKYRCFNKCLA